MYVHDSLRHKVFTKGPAGLEFLILSIYNSGLKLCIGLFYGPPSSPTEVLNNFCTTLESLDTSHF